MGSTSSRDDSLDYKNYEHISNPNNVRTKDKHDNYPLTALCNYLIFKDEKPITDDERCDILVELLKHDIDIDRTTHFYNQTPLILAFECRRSSRFIGLLIDAGANIFQKWSQSGNTILISAVCLQHELVVDKIIEKLKEHDKKNLFFRKPVADHINIKNKYGSSALFYACHASNHTIVEKLIDAGANFHWELFDYVCANKKEKMAIKIFKTKRILAINVDISMNHILNQKMELLLLEIFDGTFYLEFLLNPNQYLIYNFQKICIRMHAYNMQKVINKIKFKYRNLILEYLDSEYNLLNKRFLRANADLNLIDELIDFIV